MRDASLLELSVEPRHHSRSYRDELNFAEFPLASLSDSVPNGQKTLVFSDTIFDRSRNAPVVRKLTITASDEWGLPTAMDDEVILGLVQLSAKKKFESRKVHFTRRELIRELGWRDEGKSYLRIEESLKRWLGVTLYYDKAWWSKEEQCFVDEAFHILEQVTVFDKERIVRRAKTLPDDPNAGLSSFIWNEVVFNSFQAGYIKQLDFELYKNLKSQIAKRMYRFLDKRFYQKSKLEFDLCDFAFEKIGLSRKYHTGEIKRKLLQGIAELEQVKFIKALPTEERFVRHARGEWSVVFQSVARPQKSETQLTDNSLGQKLTARGVSANVAASLVKAYSEEKVEEKIALVDWLKGRRDTRISRNGAGFLVKAIRDDFPMPDEFTRERKSGTTSQNNARNEAIVSAAELAKQNSTAKEREEESEIQKFWNSLSTSEQETLEQNALHHGDKFLVNQYMAGKERGGALFQASRLAILGKEIRKALSLKQTIQMHKAT